MMRSAGSSGRSTSRQVVDDLCRRWQADSAWPCVPARCRILAEWTSRTSDFFLCEAARRGPPFVVKVIVRGRLIDPRDQAEALVELGRIHSGSPGSVARPPKVLAVSDRPAALALEYVPGTDLPVLIREALDGEADRSLEAPLQVCGATLGAWHRSLDAMDEPQATEQELSTAMDRLRQAAVRQRLPLESPATTQAAPHLIRRYRDFGIYNFRISTSGDVAVLDPPSATVDLDLPHRDIAWFLATMDVSASRSTSNPRGRHLRIPPDHHTLSALWGHAFLEGYVATTGCAVTEWDNRAISILEGLFHLGRCRQSLRRFEFSKAWSCVRLALRVRRRVRRTHA